MGGSGIVWDEGLRMKSYPKEFVFLRKEMSKAMSSKEVIVWISLGSEYIRSYRSELKFIWHSAPDRWGRVLMRRFEVAKAKDQNQLPID